VFSPPHLDRKEQIMRHVGADFGAQLREFSGATEHDRLLVNYPPTVAISRPVTSLKGVSSRRLRQEYPDRRSHYRQAKRLWSGSYFAGSAGGPPSSPRASTSTSSNAPPGQADARPPPPPGQRPAHRRPNR
jgi:putative transposase